MVKRIKMFMVLFLPFGFLLSSVRPISGETPASGTETVKTGTMLDDNAYLHKLMRDTWNYMDSYLAPETGFPYDSNVMSTHTNTTNIGLYLASLAVAHKLGYIETDAAVERVRKILRSLDKIENWKGLYNNWLDVKGQTKASPGPNNISDFNKLPAGLIMCRQEFPEINKECSRFLDRIDWSIFHEKSTDKLFYEYDIVAQKVQNAVFFSRGEDKLLGAFLAVASGQVPPSTWKHHYITIEKRHGLKYFKPGWQGGGIFMQYICGMFLDETATKLGYSAANFAYAQIIHARKIGSPVWGWSACENPDGGYLGMGQLTDTVITPHASVLAIHFFPKEVTQNLRALEQLGARPAYKKGDKEQEFGFRDSINIPKKKVNRNYLVLDQAMIFLSLANYLEDRVVHRIFAADPMVQNGLKKISEYKISDKDKKKFNQYLSDLEAGKMPEAIEPFGKVSSPDDPYRPEVKVTYTDDFSLDDAKPWDHASKIELGVSELESGEIQNSADLSAVISFLWSPESLYVKCNVTDQSILNPYSGPDIYKGDLVEIYLNPDGAGLVWGNPKDCQIGITPPNADGKHDAYLWFQNHKPSESEVETSSLRTQDGYQIIARISWKLLGIVRPEKKQVLGASVAINDVDNDNFGNAKLNWHFKSEAGKIELGKLILH